MKKLRTQVLRAPNCGPFLNKWVSANWPELDQFYQFLQFFYTKSKFKVGLYCEKLDQFQDGCKDSFLTHVFWCYESKIIKERLLSKCEVMTFI